VTVDGKRRWALVVGVAAALVALWTISLLYLPWWWW